jgi:hypothetical protein
LEAARHKKKGLATLVEGPGQDSLLTTFLTRGALALHNVESIYSATLSKTLSRQYLFGPLASFDVSGQWPVFMQEPHLTEVNLLYASESNLSTGVGSGVSRKNTVLRVQSSWFGVELSKTFPALWASLRLAKTALSLKN